MARASSKSASPLAFSYIRFSTPEQQNGDSLRRQTAATKDWCERSGAYLDEATTYRDLGKSAFTGKHHRLNSKNALALFLEAIQSGKVPRGSYLVIENLDRLSREEVVPATHLLTGILMAGVRVVQLSPAEFILTDKSDPFDVMRAVMELQRGHGESKMKSERLGKAWDAKRSDIGNHKLTGKCPFWLALSADRTKFVKEPRAVELVKRIFRLAQEGYGSLALAKRLNADGIRSPYGRPWNNVTVLNVLRNRAVVGDFAPHRGSPGCRKPIGPSIADYYPAILEEKEFFAVAAAIEGRKNQRGPRGVRVRNLFTGLLHDARDGTPFHITEKTPGYVRLVSYGAMRGQTGSGSKYVSFPLETFEEAILSQLAEIDPAEVLGTPEGPSEALALAGELSRLEGRIAVLEAELLNGEVAGIANVLRKLESSKADVTAKLTDARRRAATPMAAAWDETHNLLAALAKAPDVEAARSRLRSVLRRIVKEIKMLVVANGRDRLAFVQVWFGEEAHRDYGIRQLASGEWRALASADVEALGSFDLRDRKAANRLEKALAVLDND